MIQITTEGGGKITGLNIEAGEKDLRTLQRLIAEALDGQITAGGWDETTEQWIVVVRAE